MITKATRLLMASFLLLSVAACGPEAANDERPVESDEEPPLRPDGEQPEWAYDVTAIRTRDETYDLRDVMPLFLEGRHDMAVEEALAIVGPPNDVLSVIELPTSGVRGGIFPVIYRVPNGKVTLTFGGSSAQPWALRSIVADYNLDDVTQVDLVLGRRKEE